MDFRKYLIYTKRSFYRILQFFTYDIWRVSKGDETIKRINLYNILKAFILTFRNINGSQLSTKASALTYSTLLSIVPLLAVLFAIARGFGFQKIVESQLFSFFEGQEAMLQKSMEYIDKSLAYAQGGVFVGIGVLLLLYTVISLLSNIEDTFNQTWGINKSRSYYRMFTDYLALIIIAPVFLVCNAGITVFLSSVDQALIAAVASPMLKVIPYVLTILLFTLLFMYIPNTKVKFSAALLGGIFTGVGFQLFQFLYISGQIWISKYNAIYGSFAVLPLLLLWLQLTWFLTLIGVELSFAYQNVNKFSFEHETNHISRRYRDFVTLIIASLIIKRFEHGDKPYTADELSEQHRIPTRLTSDILFHLEKVGLVTQVTTEEDLIFGYIPALDINKITVSFFFDKIYTSGSENFKIDVDNFNQEWAVMLGITDFTDTEKGKILLKDL